MSKGLFIVIEGGEGAGKTTQGVDLVNWLRYSGLDAHFTREPGSGPVGEKIRDILLTPAFPGLDPRAEALLFAADRAQHVAKVIRPVMETGAVVVCDRYADSSIAYQGAGRGLGEGTIADLSAWASYGQVPDLTILLDIDPERGFGRKNTLDRMEIEPMIFHQEVRATFRELARRYRHRYLVLDASQDQATVGRKIRDKVRSMLISNLGRITVLDEPMANSWVQPEGEASIVFMKDEMQDMMAVAKNMTREELAEQAAKIDGILGIPLGEPADIRLGGEPGHGKSPLLAMTADQLRARAAKPREPGPERSGKTSAGHLFEAGQVQGLDLKDAARSAYQAALGAEQMARNLGLIVDEPMQYGKSGAIIARPPEESDGGQASQEGEAPRP